jgi:hypothetical protein
MTPNATLRRTDHGFQEWTVSEVGHEHQTAMRRHYLAELQTPFWEILVCGTGSGTWNAMRVCCSQIFMDCSNKIMIQIYNIHTMWLAMDTKRRQWHELGLETRRHWRIMSLLHMSIHTESTDPWAQTGVYPGDLVAVRSE